MVKIALNDLTKLYQKIAATHELFVPTKKADSLNFAIWQSDSDVDLKTLKTNTSIKEIIFPQDEKLAEFETAGKKLTVKETTISDTPIVIFGVRPCDAESLNILDNVFLAEPVDKFYAAKRAKTIVVTNLCGVPEESCFCHSYDYPVSGDIILRRTGEYAFLEAKTPQGENLLSLVKDLCLPSTAADQTELEAIDKKYLELYKALPLGEFKVNIDSKKLLELFNQDALWENLSISCLGCGSCTYVCPTCHCYDIKDTTSGATTERCRHWDSCMFSDFTSMAHGNPRTTKLERFRQRFMHKLVYYPENNKGVYSCTGCGRCIEACPASAHIVRVIKKLGGSV